MSIDYYGHPIDTVGRLEKLRERAMRGESIMFYNGVGLDAMVAIEIPPELALPCIEHAIKSA